MIKNRNIIFLLVNFLLGSTVIFSYIWGLQYASDPDQLWGDMNSNHIPYIVFSMLLGAIGYMTFSYFFLFIKKLSNLDTKNFKKLISLYVSILFFSSLWMPLSILYLENNNKIILLLVLLVLYVVAFSSLLLLKFIIENKQNNSLIWKLSVIGGIQFVFHTLIIDAVYWGWNFI